MECSIKVGNVIMSVPNTLYFEWEILYLTKILPASCILFQKILVFLIIFLFIQSNLKM